MQEEKAMQFERTSADRVTVTVRQGRTACTLTCYNTVAINVIDGICKGLQCTQANFKSRVPRAANSATKSAKKK